MGNTETESTVTLKALCDKVRCTSQYGKLKTPWDKLDEWQRQAHQYLVTLTYQRRRMTVEFFMGPALTEEPTADGVLECLLSDANGVEEHFDEWCRGFGYDIDSRKAERTYRACEEIAKKLRRLLGADYETFMDAERD